MAIWIDPPRWPAHGRLWSHVISDSSYEELHDFARKVGLPPRGFEGDHYDIPEERYDALVQAGAQPIEANLLVRKLIHSGLRFPKRKGERPLASYRNVLTPELLPHTLHVVASRLPTPDELTAAAATFLRDARGSILIVHSVVRGLWGAPGGGREPGESVLDCAVREIHEETGLSVPAETLRPCGYERVTFDVTEAAAYGRWGRRVSYVALFAAVVDGVRPPARPRLADVDRAEWLTFDQVEERCREVFWWPMLGHSDPWAL